jgi:multicomponent Na+:H+ antiporter subunit D
VDVLAYSAIGQAGYVLIAIAIGGPVGYAAAVLYALVNAANKTVLFLSTGLRGPLVGAIFVIGAFSVAGVPPAAGFVGKAALFQAGLTHGGVSLIVLILVGGALSFFYLLRAYQRTFWGTPARGVSSRLAARLLVFGLAVGLLCLGAWPEPLLLVSQAAANALDGAVP